MLASYLAAEGRASRLAGSHEVRPCLRPPESFWKGLGSLAVAAVKERANLQEGSHEE